jgi:hypothetical protein
MSALPLIEAVRRAGGTIALQGDRLRLSAPAPLPQKLLEEVRLHKADLIDQLRCAARPLLREPPAEPPRPGAASPNGTIAAWAGGVARLREMPPPPNYPQHAWQELIIDAGRFLEDWAAQAAALGWPVWELFGCCRRAPWGRVQGMGLILLLRGRELAALTATEAVIRTRTGTRQTYRRKPYDPLHYAERCLVWELDGER